MKKNKLPSLVTIMVLTLITVVFWVSLSTYRAFTAKPSENVPKEISDPITPTLDQDEIKQIESGIFFDSSQIPDNVVIASSLPTSIQPTRAPSLSPTPIVTPTPQVTPTPIPSPTP
jgi:hypothetical protein